MTMPNFLLIGAGEIGDDLALPLPRAAPRSLHEPRERPNFFAFEGREPDFPRPSPGTPSPTLFQLGSVRNRPSPLAFSNGFVAIILRRKQRSLRI